MKKSSKSKLFKGLTQMLAAMLVLAIGATLIAGDWASKINYALGTQSYTFETSEGGSQDTTYFKSDYNTAEELVAAREELIQRTVEEGAALLKNENGSLPLAAGAKVSLLGISSYHANYSATSGGASFAEELATRLYTACEDAGLQVNPTLYEFYDKLGSEQTENGVHPWTGAPMMAYTYKNKQDALGEIPLSAYPAQVRESYGGYNDAAVVVFSRMIGEGGDFSAAPLAVEKGGDGVHNILQLSDGEREILTEAKANFDKIIVYINTDNMLEIQELKDDPQVSAIIWSGGVGNVGMKAIADILVGNVSPSGSLPVTIATSNLSAPAATNFGEFTFDTDKLEGDTYKHYVVYAEGIYVGYRYYETRYEDMVLGQGNANGAAGSIDGNAWNYSSEVSYAFGEGLSYTTFSQKIDKVDVNANELTAEVKVTVTNTGSVAGKQPVQVYVQTPYTDYDKTNHVEKSAVQLAGYGKTGILQPGASETVAVPINLRYVASYDYVNSKSYILDEGTYYFATGNGAHDALNNILAAKGYTTANGMDADGNKELAHTWNNGELLRIVESAVGYTVTNQFDDCDLNYWLPDTVTYLSRSNWQDTWPKAYANIAPTDEMVTLLNTSLGQNASYTPDTSITMEGLTTGASTNYNLMMLYDVREDYDNELWGKLLDQMTLEDYVYCIYTLYPAVASIAMPSNNNTDGPNGLNAGFNTDPTKAYYIDEATASAALLAYRCNTYPAGGTRAATFNKDIAEEIGRMMGNDGLWTSKGGQTGPGCNLHRTAFGGRNNEYCSEDPVLTASHTAKEVVQMTEMGLAASPKHFAFNDQETFRQGLACFFNEQGARELSLRAFEGAYTEAKPLYSMSSFSRCGLEPTTSSAALLTTVLRDEWGWKGFNMSDMAHDYMPVAASIVAGTDQWCAFSNEKFVPYLNAAELTANPELAWACREAAHRVMYMTLNSNAINGLHSDARVVHVNTWWENTLLGVDIGLSVLTLACFALYTLSVMQDKKKITV